MLFRGVLQASLIGRFGVPGGLGLASMFVGVIQPISISYMVWQACSGFISAPSGSSAATF